MTVLSDVYSVNPTMEAISLEDRPGYLRLKPRVADDVYVLLDNLSGDYVFEIHYEFTPNNPAESGGIAVVKTLPDGCIELLDEYSSTETVHYTKLRMVKQGQRYKGYGYIKEDRTWILVGATDYEASLIGIVYHSSPTSTSNFDVDKLLIYKSTYLTITNISPGMVAEIYDSEGNIIDSGMCQEGNDYIKLDLSYVDIPLNNATIKLYDADGNLIYSSVFNDIYGGDVFEYGVAVEVRLDNELIREYEEVDLGRIVGGELEKMLTIKNITGEPLQNITIKSLPIDNDKSYLWVYFAFDDVEPTYQQGQITIPFLAPEQTAYLRMKIVRDTSVVQPGEYYRFVLSVSN